MKITVTENKSYKEIMALPHREHQKPNKSNLFWRTLLKLVSLPALLNTNFKCEKIGMEKLPKNQPALVLMNHSGFIDLEIIVSVLFPRPFNIITTSDAFIGMDWLMRQIGCVPTNKFTTDANLVRDMMHITRKLKNSVVLFPEASYSFDGTATEIGHSTGKLIKLLKVPVVMVRTYGAFHHDPLYNNLQTRKNEVSATMTYLISPEDIESKSAEELDEIVRKEFSFDNFAWQKENKIKVDVPWRADYLNRVLYKCPKCQKEGKMEGKGIKIVCKECGASYTLDEYGYLSCDGGKTAFDHIPSWYNWERECVKKEIADGTYRLDTEVDILLARDTKKLYRVGKGRLVHTIDGFTLDGCDGELHYEHKPLCSHSLYADYNWYELGDIICIGNSDCMYYCFPKCEGDVVAKARLATEEIYKIRMQEKSAVTK